MATVQATGCAHRLALLLVNHHFDPLTLVIYLFVTKGTGIALAVVTTGGGGGWAVSLCCPTAYPHNHVMKCCPNFVTATDDWAQMLYACTRYQECHVDQWFAGVETAVAPRPSRRTDAVQKQRQP
jgi:hypothetical protein